ncbi:hypothetical protein B296_00015540 [Ensete ventricosum]|uniref:Uncharacterized protein n=1 Tax=Ensete ventricosum TaxID=4639 RepID=A0A427AR82_ENSVE|nr:hypothetical protein B296_00015540 [Ensete ventricosum]
MERSHNVISSIIAGGDDHAYLNSIYPVRKLEHSEDSTIPSKEKRLVDTMRSSYPCEMPNSVHLWLYYLKNCNQWVCSISKITNSHRRLWYVY